MIAPQFGYAEAAKFMQLCANWQTFDRILIENRKEDLQSKFQKRKLELIVKVGKLMQEIKKKLDHHGIRLENSAKSLTQLKIRTRNEWESLLERQKNGQKDSETEIEEIWDEMRQENDQNQDCLINWGVTTPPIFSGTNLSSINLEFKFPITNLYSDVRVDLQSRKASFLTLSGKGSKAKSPNFVRLEKGFTNVIPKLQTQTKSQLSEQSNVFSGSYSNHFDRFLLLESDRAVSDGANTQTNLFSVWQDIANTDLRVSQLPISDRSVSGLTKFTDQNWNAFAHQMKHGDNGYMSLFGLKFDSGELQVKHATLELSDMSDDDGTSATMQQAPSFKLTQNTTHAQVLHFNIYEFPSAAGPVSLLIGLVQHNAPFVWFLDKISIQILDLGVTMPSDNHRLLYGDMYVDMENQKIYVLYCFVATEGVESFGLAELDLDLANRKVTPCRTVPFESRTLKSVKLEGSNYPQKLRMCVIRNADGSQMWLTVFVLGGLSLHELKLAKISVRQTGPSQFVIKEAQSNLVPSSLEKLLKETNEASKMEQMKCLLNNGFDVKLYSRPPKQMGQGEEPGSVECGAFGYIRYLHNRSIICVDGKSMSSWASFFEISINQSDLEFEDELDEDDLS